VCSHSVRAQELQSLRLVGFMAPWPDQSCPHADCGQPIRDLLAEMVPNADQARPEFKLMPGALQGYQYVEDAKP
jgi:hypothetical protein